MTQQKKSIEAKLNYSFNDKKLLELALTHKSSSNKHNERLEFLGDAILSSIITAEIFKRFYVENEGILSRIRSQLIKKEKLIAVANRLGISTALKVSVSEKKRGNNAGGSILADTLEAIIGAIFLDSNWDTCCKTITSWYLPELSSSKIISQDKDPKTKLQEYMQALSHPIPKYKVTHTHGKEHNQTVTIVCTVTGLSIQSNGTGKTIKKAEQEAAKTFLQELQQKEQI